MDWERIFENPLFRRIYSQIGNRLFRLALMREQTKKPKDPTKDPEILRVLDRYAQLLYKKKFFDLSPRAQVIVSIAAFHPGAHYLAQRYPIEILKHDIVLDWLLGTRKDVGQFVPREYSIGKVKVKTMDLMRAANLGAVARTQEATQFLRELGWQAIPTEGFWHGIISGLLGHTPQIELHPYTMRPTESGTIQALLPREPSEEAYIGAELGKILADLPLLIGASALGRVLLRPTLRVPDWFRYQVETSLSSPVIGAIRGAQEGKSPEEIGIQAAKETALLSRDILLQPSAHLASLWALMFQKATEEKPQISWENFRRIIRSVVSRGKQPQQQKRNTTQRQR
jgi:hypothetical protein